MTDRKIGPNQPERKSRLHPQEIGEMLLPIWQDQAVQVVDATDSGSVTVVSGPFGIGKSQLLKKAIIKEAESRGYQVAHQECWVGGMDLNFFLNRVNATETGSLTLAGKYPMFEDENNQKKLLIIDEAQLLALDLEEVDPQKMMSADYDEQMKLLQKQIDTAQPTDPALLIRLMEKFQSANVQVIYICVSSTKELGRKANSAFETAAQTSGRTTKQFEAIRNIPSDWITKVMDLTEADQKTRDFFLDPKNKAITCSRLFFKALELIDLGGLDHLKAMIKKDAYKKGFSVNLPLVGMFHGGSKVDAISLLENNGALAEDIDHSLIPDY